MTLDNIIQNVSREEYKFNIDNFHDKIFNDYICAANISLKKINSDFEIRKTNIFDLQKIYDLQIAFDNLSYSKDEIEYFLQHNSSLNYSILDKNDLICTCIGYPSQDWKKIIVDTEGFPHLSVKSFSELDDINSFFLELKVTKENYQRKGIYRLMRGVFELSVNEKGFTKIHLFSSESAYNIHLQEGFELIQYLPKFWNLPEKTLNEYFMKIELTTERIEKNKQILNIL